MQSADEIARSRAWFAPARAPFTWVTGSVPAGVEIGGTSFRARDGHEVAVRTYRPRHTGSEALPAMLWFHGGGWVLGNTRGYDPLCAWIADRRGSRRAQRRLPPRARAPGAPGSARLRRRRPLGRLGLRSGASDSSRAGIRHSGLGLAGDSAGGNLAAVTAQVLRAEGGADVGYQALVYPAVDATMSSPSVAQHAQAPILTRSDMDTFLAHYLGDADDALGPGRPAGLPPARPGPRRSAAGARPDRGPRPPARRGHGLCRSPAGGRRRGAAHELPSRPARLHELPGSHPGRRCRPRRARPSGSPGTRDRERVG